MEQDKKTLLKNYLANVKVNLNVAAFTHCPISWRDIDYIPEYSKFYFICDGEGWLKINDKEFYPKAGQLFLMPAGIIQSYSAISANTFKKYWCHFTANIGDMNLFDIVRLPYFIDVKDQDVLENLFHQLIIHYESDEITAALKAKAVLCEIIAYYLDNVDINAVLFSNSSTVDKLNCVINYIEKHLSEEITVESLARIVHFHPNYFIKIFHNYIGCSPIQYVNRLKVDRAKLLLKTTHFTIKEVSDMLGFNDAGYFSKIFKRYTGFSPQEFRE